jgi:hypothetical protein
VASDAVPSWVPGYCGCHSCVYADGVAESRKLRHPPLMSLPHLSDEERRGILGENAIRRMGLTVAGRP